MYSDQMSYADLEKFDDEVLNIENPQLQRYFMNQEPLLPEHDTHYIKALVEYVNLRKENYAKYVPSYAWTILLEQYTPQIKWVIFIFLQMSEQRDYLTCFFAAIFDIRLLLDSHK